MIPNANDFSIFRLRSRRRETGSIWSKDSVNTVNKIAPLQEPVPMIPIQSHELILTVTVFHPILKKKDQEFLILASQPLKALLGMNVIYSRLRLIASLWSQGVLTRLSGEPN